MKKNRRVGAHFKPSLGRVVDTYDRQQEAPETQTLGGSATPPREALAALATTRDGRPAPLVFPRAEHKPPKKRLLGRIREYLISNTGSVPRLSYDMNYHSYRYINRNGEGVMRAERTTGEKPSHSMRTIRIEPNQTLNDDTFTHFKDYSNTNMPGLTVGADVTGTTWAGAELRGSLFSGELINVNFDGANLPDATFRESAFHEVSMRGANVTGADFTKIVSPERGNWEYTVDFTDSNVTAEQFDAVIDRIEDTNPLSVYKTSSLRSSVRIRRHTPQEFMALTGIDEDELTVLLWTGEIEYRSHKTNRVERGEPFDASRHYIPQWEAQRLINEKAVSA